MLDSASVRAVLLDIEGTTTPVSFVYDVLFPYARANFAKFLQQHSHESSVQAALAQLRSQRTSDLDSGRAVPPEAPTELETLIAYAHWLMSQDSKTGPLKTLQGMIWQEGYETGELKGLVFSDVPGALRRWHDQGKQIFIYSSGSVLAQKLIFGHTDHGDLTSLLNGYFDTAIGAKSESSSYSKIAAGIGIPPAAILFLSDAPRELDAANSAGLQTAHCVRPGNPYPHAPGHAAIRTFDSIPF